MSRQGVEHQCLSSEELKQRFPNIRLARGEVGLLDKSGGVLYADKALRALQVMLCSIGAMPLLVWASWVPISHPLIPVWDEGLCMPALVLTFGRAVLYTPLGLVNMGEEV